MYSEIKLAKCSEVLSDNHLNQNGMKTVLMTVPFFIVVYCYSEQHSKHMVFVYKTGTDPFVQELARWRLKGSPGLWRQTHLLK